MNVLPDYRHNFLNQDIAFTKTVSDLDDKPHLISIDR